MNAEATAISDGRLLEIVSACEGVTPGPWIVEDKNGAFAEARPDWKFRPLRIVAGGKRILYVGDSTAQLPLAAFIALANPSTVAAMAEELMLLRAVADEARFLIDRLHDLESGWEDAEAYREFCGHVSPSISRLKGIMPTSLQD